MKEGSPLQSTLFSGKWVDNRTRRQKRSDRDRNTLKQTEMFSQRDLAQFGVRARPVMNLHPGRLQLIMEDPRTPEECEADLLREAEQLTKPMFTSDEGSVSEAVKPDTQTQPDAPTLPAIMVSHGLRRRLRAATVTVRRR